MITNGTRLTGEWLKKNGPNLNWLGISCDSAIEDIQKKLGRGSGNHVKNIRKSFQIINAYNLKNQEKHIIQTKLNSTITRFQADEDMSDFLIECKPHRWKIFQILYIEGENDKFYKTLSISKERFSKFVKKHRHLERQGITIVPETSADMIESYLMIDPKGQFYQNTENKHFCSQPILSVGLLHAFQEIEFKMNKFCQRGGMYFFDGLNHSPKKVN